MKKIIGAYYLKIIISLCLLCSISVFSALVFAGGIPFPAPGHEGLNVESLGGLGDLDIGLWVQYRVMYNNSNIPGPGGTTFDSTEDYDFFRQRFRLALDVKQREGDIGGYIQLEFRGGWGGSSPGESDPRDGGPTNNPFNRIQSRGVRYGFVYANFDDISFGDTFSVAAGIIPLTDRVGRTLFDADWDFNVGGVVLGGRITHVDYRLSYVRLIEGVGGAIAEIGDDYDLFLADFNWSFNESTEVGGHVYVLESPDTFGVMASKAQAWYGITGKTKINTIDLNGILLFNNGRIAGDTHNGTAFKIEGSMPLGNIRISALAINTSGDDTGEVSSRFVTIHELVGTAGFWGYNHIFTPNGPSDVNDVGLEIGNSGAGMTTIQVKVSVPVLDKLSLHFAGGAYKATKERNNSNDMGTELSAMAAYNVDKNLNFEIGVSYAMLGDFFAPNADNLRELFCRFQYTW